MGVLDLKPTYVWGTGYGLTNLTVAGLFRELSGSGAAYER